MFDILGIAVGLYAFYAAASGEVWARSGAGARLVTRDQSPHYFWMVIAIYVGLGLAMVFYF